MEGRRLIVHGGLEAYSSWRVGGIKCLEGQICIFHEGSEAYSLNK